MRSGAAGSTRIASSPAMRINWRRLRACSLLSIPAIGFIDSIELLAMARRQDAVAVQQQRRDAHELLDLGQGVLVVLVAFFLRHRRGQPGEVGERFAALLGQRRVLARGQAEAAEETAAPFEQRTAAL